MSSIEKAVSSSPLEDYQAIGQAAKKQVNRFFVFCVPGVVSVGCRARKVVSGEADCMVLAGFVQEKQEQARGKGCSGTVDVYRTKTNEPPLALPSTSGKRHTVSSTRDVPA